MNDDQQTPFSSWAFAGDGPGPDGVEPGAVLRSPSLVADPPLTVTGLPAAATSAPSPVTDQPIADHPKPVGYPWVEDHQDYDHEPGVTVGPMVRTERLYRSANFPDPTKGANPRAGSGHGEDDLSGASADATNDPLWTIDPMSAAPADIRDPGQHDADGLAAAPSPVLRADDRGISSLVVFLLICGITTAVGLYDMVVNRQFTWITGTAFVTSCVLGAVLVRPRDLWTAVIAPPLAYLVALLIAGQPSTLTSTGSLVIREISLVGTGLAFNAPFIFGGTAAALVLVLIRRARLATRG